MISSIAWVPTGVADPNPKKYEMSAVEEELVRTMQEEKHGPSAPPDTKAQTQLPQVDISTLPADLRMDEYSSDEEDDGGQKQGVALGKVLLGQDQQFDLMEDDEDDANEDDDDGKRSAASSPEEMKGVEDSGSGSDEDGDSDDDLADVPDTREFAPLDMAGLEAMGLSHIGLNSDHPDLADDESEAHDVQLSEHDAIALVAKTEEDYPSLEVHVYDQQSGNLYVHHDIPLPAFPLSLAHGQVCGDRTGGQDTSLTDELMRMQLTGNKKPKMADMNQSSGLKSGSHTDAVMALSWNSIHKQVLASGSADGTVKLWDVTHCETDSANASTFRHHKNKVQSVAWNPHEGTLLATGSFDRTVALVDARGDGSNSKSFKIPADCEAIVWDPFTTEKLTVLTEDGAAACWDVRKLDKPVWSTVVSEFGGVTDLSYNSKVPGLMVTCSTDKSITLWDVKDAQPERCGSKDMCAGKLYTASFYPSSPWLLGCGGAGNLLSLWDLSSEDTVRSRFSDRLGSTSGAEPKNSSADADLEKMISNKGAELSDNTGAGAEHSKERKKGKGKKGKKKKSR